MASTEQMTSVLPRHETLVVGEASASRSIGEWTEGQRIGPFRLVRRLGKGGMGQVWLAHQLQPLIRDVALKVMLPERRSARAEAFFEVERQALAQLSHRAIAQIYDAGRLPDGALFFAMEYVPGRPLDDYLRLNPLPLVTLVRMFIELCNGMQHAHQRGLIHRDLKPQNILVQDTEAGPLPRIIDFGIALGASTDGPTPLQAHLIAGTPAYMSPEQRHVDEQGIDARCDIYALGVMLAECLRQHVGLPFDSRAPEGTALRQEFARSLDSHGTVSGEAATLRRAPFELRAIALKALADDREQRYASAASMAEDLQRWQRREPVLAVRGGRRYELRCFLQRNALATAAASLIGLALIGGTGLALYGLAEAREGRAQAEAAQALAEQRRGEAEQLIQYMLGDFADKLRPLGRLDLLDSIGSEALKYLGEADGRGNTASHLARARALRTLGEVQVTRQQFEQATPILGQAARLLDEAISAPGARSEELHFESGQVAYWRGLIAYRQRDHHAAEVHWGRYLSEARAFDALTDDHNQGQQEIAYALNNLGSLTLNQDRAGEALSFFTQAAYARKQLDLEDSDPRTLELADTLSWIGNAQEMLGQPDHAIDSKLAALELLRRHKEATGETPRARQTEANLSLMIAELSIDLGRRATAYQHLRSALSVAIRDVENDSSQPRRQALLARAAFLTAHHLISESSEERSRAFSIGSQAADIIRQSHLSSIEKHETTAYQCIAGVSLEIQDSACLSERGHELLQELESGSKRTIALALLFDIASHPDLTDKSLRSDIQQYAKSLEPAALRPLRVQRALERLKGDEVSAPRESIEANSSIRLTSTTANQEIP